MAIFNPQIQAGNDDMPNYFKYSEPIKGVEANTSTGIALKAAGTALEGGAELADSTVKAVIKTDVDTRVDNERQSFTGFLDATINPATTPSGPDAPVDLMARGADSPPTAITRGINKIGTTQAGLDGNKIDETLYYQRVGNIAKDLRATYPGYRDYIDKEVSKITGVDPANAYITGIIAKINSQASTANKDKEYWEKEIVKNSGFPQSEQILADFRQTGDSTKVMHWLATNNAPIAALALKKSAFDSSKDDKADQLSKANDLADSTILHAATIGFTNQKQFGGVSPQDLADRFTQLALHPEMANDQVYRDLSAQYEGMKTQVYNQAAAQLNERRKGPDGKLLPSVADVIGAEAVKKKLDDGIGLLFNKTSEFITNKQFGPAYTLQTSGEAVASNMYFKVLTDPSLEGRVATAAALNKAAPNASPVLMGQMLGKGLAPALATFTAEQGRMAVAQPLSAGTYMGANGKVYSFSQALDEQKKGAQLTGVPVPGQAISNLVDLRKIIIDPASDPGAKANAIRFFYDPVANKGSMDKLMRDYYDPTKPGGVVKGRESAFTSLTEENITKSIWHYSQHNDHDAWLGYSQWAKGEFATQFHNQVMDIDKINRQSTTSTREGGLPDSQFKVSWDSDNHQFILKNWDNTPLEATQSTRFNSAYRSVTSLNQGLKNMAVIAKTEGTNVDAYIFKTLKDNGFSPTKDVEGIPSQLMRSMITANGGKVKTGAQAPDAPAVPTSKFAEEPVPSDLKSFLTNPVPSQGRTAPVLEPYQTRGIIKGNLSDQPIDAPIRLQGSGDKLSMNDDHITPLQMNARLGQLLRDKAASRKAGDDVDGPDYSHYNSLIRDLQRKLKAQ